jgi:RNA polymerase sigma-70 factor (ECF subfamily)
MVRDVGRAGDFLVVSKPGFGEMITDWDYLERARQGDESAWHWLILRHNPTLLRTILLITGSLAVAKDLAQETFVRLLERGPRHREGSFKAYLSTIAYRLALKEKQRARRQTNLDTCDLSDPGLTPLEELLGEEQERQLAVVLTELSEPHRAVLILRFYGHHSYEEIAQITAVPLGTVKSRLFHAVQACRRGMHEKGLLE